MRAAAVILTKDLRLRLRDRSVFLFAFVVPLGLAFVFSLVFPDTDEFRMSAAVVDLDGGPVAAGFVDGVVPQLVAAGVVDLEDVEDEAAARDAVERGTVDAAWLVPAGFSEDATAGRGGSLHVLINPDRALAAEVARGVAEQYTAQIDRAALAAATTVTALGGVAETALVEDAATEAATGPPPVTLDELVAEDRRLDPVSRLAAGMAVFFLFFTVQYGVTGLLEERDLGTLPRLLAAPIGAGAVHLGKALGAFVLGVVSMTVLAVASSLLLGAHWGHPAGVAILIVAGVLSALGIMALVGSFARTAEQAGNLQSIVALILGLLGGVFFPVGGGVLGQLSLVSPHGWFLRGLGDVVGTGRWSAALPAAAALVAVGLVAAVPGVQRLPKGTA
jgi:ABC-2 type transport system permease protein